MSRSLFCHSLLLSQYQWKLSTSSSPAVDAVFKLAKLKLPALLEAKLREFPQAILDAHGKDVIVTGTPDDSRTGTPAPPTVAAPEAPKASTPVLTTKVPNQTSTSKKTINTATVRVEGRFMASADDLFTLLTNEARIPAWSRAPAQVRR